MKVYLKDISSGARDFIGTIAADHIQSEGGYLAFTTPFAVKATVRRFETTVTADIALQGEYRSFCARCLKDITALWHQDFFITMAVQRTTEYVDLDEKIYQEVFLELPVRTLCHEFCKGLCPECGVNLNEQLCQHKS